MLMEPYANIFKRNDMLQYTHKNV